jgi:uncharacterized protein YjbI with pentapeptide repeats
MRLLKPLRASFVHRVFGHRGTNHLVATVAFCLPTQTPRTPVSEPELWKLATSDLGRFGVLDHWMFKPQAEVLVTGACFTGERPKGSEYVRLVVAQGDKKVVDKRLYVFGDRRWTLMGPTDPEMFSRMPLDYAHAFGGEKFAQNPLGKGHAKTKDAAGTESHPLPNVEDPRNLIKSEGDRPAPASFAPWDLMWPVHFEKKMGSYSRDWVEKHGFDLADDVDFSLFNVAAEDQRSATPWTGEETLRFENMHPEARVLEMQLPGFLGRTFLRFKERYAADRGLIEVPMRIDTLHAFPHRERVLVTCRGIVPIHTMDGSDVELILAAVDDADPAKRRPVAHYAEELERRLDKDRGAQRALRDGPLMPERAELAPESDGKVDDPLEEVRPLGLAQRNARRRVHKELVQSRETALAAGVDPALVPEVPAFTEPSEEELAAAARTPNVEAAMDTALAEKEKAEALAERERKDLQEKLESLAKEHKFEIPDAKGYGEGPPRFTAEGELRRMRELVNEGERFGRPVEELRAKVEDSNFRAKLLDLQARLVAAYRVGAHLQLPARPMSLEQSEQAKAAILAVLHGLDPEHRDFTGADLRGLDLSGIDLSGAFLEATKLSGARLTNANLSNAVLAHSDLAGTDLTGCDLTGANLGHASARGAKFTHTDLGRATLSGADVGEADFSGSKLHQSQWLEVKAPNAIFDSATGDTWLVYKSDLTGARARGARLPSSAWVSCEVDRLDATNADLSKSSMVQSRANDANLAGATLDNFRIVESSMERADFSNCSMTNSNLRGAKLASAKLRGVSMRRSDVSEADLRGADLEGVIATESLFVDTNLTGSKLRGANLMLAIMHRAKLASADITQANLFCADLTGAEGDDKTSFRGSNVKRALIAGVNRG